MSTLAEASEDRKARLEALRRRKAGLDTGDSVIINRNYNPETRTIKKHTNDDDKFQDTVEKDVEGLAEKIILEDEQRRAQELDVFNIAPKRPNWDLKRDMDKKLAKLERKTQEAIHTLIRQRLAAQKGQTDELVGAMRAQGTTETVSSDEEDED